MADNWLENHYDEWLKRKTEWERNKSRRAPQPRNNSNK